MTSNLAEKNLNFNKIIYCYYFLIFHMFLSIQGLICGQTKYSGVVLLFARIFALAKALSHFITYIRTY